jgi:adenylate kinase
VPQSETFDAIMVWAERPYRVLDLQVSDEEVIRRQLERAKVEHRPDSATEEQIQARLDQYRTATEPILDFFRAKGLVTDIDGEVTPDEVASAVHAALTQ